MRFKKKVYEIANSMEDIDKGFEDILELSRYCKFSSCTHATEPDCGVRKAICEGILPEERFNYYYRIKHEAEYVAEQKNKTKAMDYMKQLKLFQKP